MNSVHVRCPAKVNLTLEVLGRRPDGYHELRTVFQAIDLCDELTVSLADEDAFEVTGDIAAPADGSNLCLKALERFRERLGIAPPVAMTLHKRIPMQAGLGGGSSDAAGTLLALEALSGARATGLAGQLAPELGSDVAFFLHGGAMVGAVRGEDLTPVAPLVDGAFLVAKPAVAVSTAEAYGMLAPADFTDGHHTAQMAQCLREGCALPEVASRMYNAFARPVETRWPVIRATRDRLQRAEPQATLLCGSGAAIFGLFENGEQAQRAADLNDDLWTAVARPLPAGVQWVTP